MFCLSPLAHTPICAGRHKIGLLFAGDAFHAHTPIRVGGHFAGFTSEKKGKKPRVHRQSEIGACAMDCKIICANGNVDKKLVCVQGTVESHVPLGSSAQCQSAFSPCPYMCKLPFNSAFD
ncbi:hypothetical protein AVEN_150698-1 [Araneus ventricosus]|uniref:Uncharacterized protein n=1 Tax=Araneus ventricosus TaxID=182803 RepID=A0A4Y2LRR3_ARAVE|nr:hypothetical protein AVEN_150698-1 [Araneus ventricosus]